MTVIRRDLTTEKLIGKDNISAYSPWIVISKQHTVVAVGLKPGFEVHFEIAVIKAGALGKAECCGVMPPTMSDIERTEKLLCPTCPTCDKEFVRLTAGNQVLILDAPQGAAIRAVLVDADTGEPVDDIDDIRAVDVFTYINTATLPANAAQRGCPPKTVYSPSFRFPSRGLGFRPTDRFIDPEATVELRDCDGVELASIYPTPRLNAGTEIADCRGNVIGYAVDSEHGDDELACDTPKKWVVAITPLKGAQKVLYNDGTTAIIKD